MFWRSFPLLLPIWMETRQEPSSSEPDPFFLSLPRQVAFPRRVFTGGAERTGAPCKTHMKAFVRKPNPKSSTRQHPPTRSLPSPLHAPDVHKRAHAIAAHILEMAAGSSERETSGSSQVSASWINSVNEPKFKPEAGL